VSKTVTIRARFDPQLKHDAEIILSMLGLSHTEAITLFYRQMILQHGLPFEIKIPSEEALEAIRRSREWEHLPKYDSLEDLMSDLHEE
jgi:DNA-damage-inducible protein J